MANKGNFDEEYKKLNKAQKDAVDSIDGPVMVVAGPGTGKTRVLAIRVGNILAKGAGEASEILSLTFTNSGVKAMKSRLEEYIGSTAHNVHISTFHAFALELVKEHYNLLGFSREPEILSDDEAVFLVDEILNNHEWEHIRPRTNPTLYFNDLKHLISLLKRERLSIKEFQQSVEAEIKNLKNDPENLSSRGESKGKIKKEVERGIEALGRTHEVVEFYRIYEEKKREMFLMDYDDVFEYAVELVEKYENVQANLREKYQYILVDEHQDSSGIQNSFLKAVWQGVEKPNIFVVGDDRQLIYAFSGANMTYFEEFKHIFGKAKLIILTENYRSPSNILALADDLLQSSITKEKLKSNIKGGHKVNLSEYTYPRDEILGAGLYFKRKIEEGMEPGECALLVPKNHHVRTAIEILENMGLPVSSGRDISLFELKVTASFLQVLKIIAQPYGAVTLAQSLLDDTSGIETLSAHKFIKNTKEDLLTIEKLKNATPNGGLFDEEDAILKWGKRLENWVNTLSSEKISKIVSIVGNELFIDRAKNHDELIRNVEVVRTFIHLAEMFEEKNTSSNLLKFLDYCERLKLYGTHIGLAAFGHKSGVEVMTLHRSKGLEYKCVWVAHMNEEIFMSEKKNGFTLPESIKIRITKRDMEIAKRELYVAITRTKEFCSISYARENYTMGEMELAHIIRELPETHFIKKNSIETEQELLKNGPEIYTKVARGKEHKILEDLKKFVKENYNGTKVSVTMLNNFFECPWKWYFRNFLKLPEVKSVSLALGSLVHSTIEFILNEHKVPADKILKNKIIYYINKEGVKDEREVARLARSAMFTVSRFVKDFYPKLSEDHKSERSIQFRDLKFPNFLMYGKIDLTERNKVGEISVTDFKTGSSKTKGMIEKLDEEGRLSPYMRQLVMYSYLIRGAERKNVSTSKLLFLEADKKDKNILYSTHISKEQIDMLLKDITDYDTLLKSGDWVEHPCRHNSYGKHTGCEYCKMAEIYL